MKILVTGSAGFVGTQVAAALGEAGHDVVGFDLVDGLDVRDVASVDHAVRGVAAVVHLAAIPNEGGADPATMMATNVGGTWNLLCAAAAHRVERLVLASSVNAFGVFRRQREPDYLPIDDDHPVYASSAYGVSKHLGEELCAMATRTNGITTICLRIPRVVAPEQYASLVRSQRRARKSTGYGGWEYGIFIDLRDLADAFVCSVAARFGGHARLLVAADDAMGRVPVEIADELYPRVVWHARSRFTENPRQALVDTEPARATLGWRPTRTWAEQTSPRSGARRLRWRRKL
jgi:nucleoside-diphosphate-sugar epimerase